MREAVLADFFVGRVTTRELAEDVRGSTTRVSATQSTTGIENMGSRFLVTREMAIALCNAALSGELPPTDLETIGFALVASENFYWDESDDEPAETFYDWSAPEINFALTHESIRMFRDRLMAKVE
jgi:hypothetical protein